MGCRLTALFFEKSSNEWLGLVAARVGDFAPRPLQDASRARLS